ncbi:MAG TPA: hypothetical protein VEW48_14105 [Thermoanaerobaculia bacterium]|nr:hypothetical protein [Thermoanaerobaculia bacterium]
MGHVAFLRKGLREGAGELQKVRGLLVGLQERVPPPPAEAVQEDRDAEPSPLTEMLAAIECGIHDRLDPLIRDLLAAAEYQAERPRRGQPEV